jgi:hypothetical protein
VRQDAAADAARVLLLAGPRRAAAAGAAGAALLVVAHEVIVAVGRAGGAGLGALGRAAGLEARGGGHSVWVKCARGDAQEGSGRGARAR